LLLVFKQKLELLGQPTSNACSFVFYSGI